MVLKKFLSLILSFALIVAAIASDLRRILPVSVKIREGEDLQLRLIRALDEAVSCYVKTPLLTSFNLLSEEPDSEGRISYWTENGECGVVARNVTREDAGRWRLTAKNSTDTLVDASFVEILDKVDAPERNFSIESGSPYTLTLEEQSRYCWVHQPHSDESIVVGGECKVDIDQPTAAVEGKWLATAGVPGQLKEVPINAELYVFRDRLATGYKINNQSNSISAYCNLRDSDRALEFCRFSKPDGVQTGFQLSDGLRSGRYGYYGAGLENGECGITIESPTGEDYGQWLCFVGVKDEAPFGSFVWLNRNSNRAAVTRAEVLPTNATTTVLNDVLQLKCEVTVPITYCWFRAPDGKIFTPAQQVTDENVTYRYVGNGLGKGQCGMEITNAEANHQGQWSCHMGPEPSGVELSSTIDVRIAETPLAAENTHITAAEGESLSIRCRTVPKRTSIDYCRFFMPDGTGIHITDEVTETDTLIHDGTSYWFSGISLQLGGCGLTINRISSKHFGNWTCAARLELNEGNNEVFDTILVYQEGQASDAAQDNNWTAGATTGIISGIIVLVAVVVGGTMYTVKRIRARGYQDNISGVDTISVSASSSGSESANSGISLEELPSNVAVRQ